MGQVNLDEIKQIAKEAGDKIMGYYHDGFNVDKKDGNQPVTEADISSDRILQEKLSKFGFPILSEESKDDLSRLKSEFIWVIDPLDGTSDFIDKTGEFSVLVGLVQNNEPVLGVVYEPVTKKFYYARKGEGAFIEENGEKNKLNISDIGKFNDMRILVSRNHLGEIEIKLIENLKIGGKIIKGSAGIKLSKIAEGEAEIYINSSDKTSEWDTCAGVVILRESGGRITNMQGDEILYNQKNSKHVNGYVATNGKNHNEIIEALHKIV